MYPAQSHAEPHTLTGEPNGYILDAYARRGVAITRDAAAIVTAALYRDAYEMESRGGRPNEEAAATNRALARHIGQSLR